MHGPVGVEQPMATEAMSSPDIGLPEKARREENFRREMAGVCEKYPQLSEKIKRSLETPQLGEYHNEGQRMDSHLSLMLVSLERLIQGNVHEMLVGETELVKIMQGVATAHDEKEPERITIAPACVEYVFFHDIAKPDCLSLKFEDEKKGFDISWQQWKTIESGGEPYRWKGKPIKSISFYHASEGPYGQHGNKGAQALKGKGISRDILTAIHNHEVVFQQFDRISAANYEKHFVEPGFTEDLRNFIFTGSYIDLVSSIRPDGKPNLDRFVNLVRSRNNFLLIQEYMKKGSVFPGNSLVNLKKRNDILTRDDIEEALTPQT